MNISFKGQDAVKLNALYMQNPNSKEQKAIFRQLSDIGKQENFDVFMQNDNGKISTKCLDGKNSNIFPWAQDNKIIINKNGQYTVLYLGQLSNKNNVESAKKFSFEFARMKKGQNKKTTIRNSKMHFEGGDVYLGKKDDGEPWIMIGEDIPKFNPDYKKLILDEMGIKEENIYVVPQIDYHLDTSIRPIGYPYVLVNDSVPANSYGSDDELSIDNLFYDKSDTLLQQMNDFLNLLRGKSYATTDNVADALAQQGFKPIKIAGIFNNGQINFLNAIVNKHDDGSISYITNSAKCDDKDSNEYEEKFKADLQNALNQQGIKLKNIYFVSGDIDLNNHTNDIMQYLKTMGGGVHCLVCEEAKD